MPKRCRDISFDLEQIHYCIISERKGFVESLENTEGIDQASELITDAFLKYFDDTNPEQLCNYPIYKLKRSIINEHIDEIVGKSIRKHNIKLLSTLINQDYDIEISYEEWTGFPKLIYTKGYSPEHYYIDPITKTVKRYIDPIPQSFVSGAASRKGNDEQESGRKAKKIKHTHYNAADKTLSDSLPSATKRSKIDNLDNNEVEKNITCINLIDEKDEVIDKPLETATTSTVTTISYKDAAELQLLLNFFNTNYIDRNNTLNENIYTAPPKVNLQVNKKDSDIEMLGKDTDTE